MFLRKIKDIRIKNNEIATIRDAKISVKELETQISKLSYSGTGKGKDPNVEKAKFPPFIQVFYYLFFAYLKVPSEKKVFETYLKWLGNSSKETFIYKDQTYDLNSVKNRFLRTYPSLIRDLHFLYLLQESRLFQKIEYSMEQDYFNGLDLKITQRNVEYFISLFIDTGRAKFYKRRKKERHDYSIVNEIELKVDFESLKLFGSIYLLNSSHVELLIREINK